MVQYEYKLPKEWVEYLIKQPETGMGYQIVDMYFKGKTLENVVILNCDTVRTDCKELEITEIERIVLKKDETN